MENTMIEQPAKLMRLAIAQPSPDGVEIIGLVEGKFEKFLLPSNVAAAIVASIVDVMCRQIGVKPQCPTTPPTTTIQ